MVGSGTPRANSSKLKLALRPGNRNPQEIQGFNAESREHSLSAFCVNWLTGSFRAKNLSSAKESQACDRPVIKWYSCKSMMPNGSMYDLTKSKM